MHRGGFRGGGRGGRGGGMRGGGGVGGAMAGAVAPLGLSREDLQQLAMRAEPTALFPALDQSTIADAGEGSIGKPKGGPTHLAPLTPADLALARTTLRMTTPLDGPTACAAYVVDLPSGPESAGAATGKGVAAALDIERYSDRYSRTTSTAEPDLLALKPLFNPDFFPAELWHAVFNPRLALKRAAAQKKGQKRTKIDLDRLGAEGEEGSDEEEQRRLAREAGQADEGELPPDYNEDPEEFGEDDYAANYFDNGEGDDDDALGDAYGGHGSD